MGSLTLRGTFAVLLAATLGGCAIGGDGTAGTGEARDLGPAGQLVGGYVGQQMSEQDRGRVRLALDASANNQPTSWQGTQGRSFKVTPVRTFTGEGGTRCRDFDTQTTIDGRHQRIRGTACRQPDGSWRPLAD